MAAVSIKYTETFQHSLSEISSYLRTKGLEPLSVIEKILDEFEKKIYFSPVCCQISPELAKLGVTNYRECNTQNGYRVIYSIDSDEPLDTVVAHVITHQRQDVQSLLFNRIIAY
ncbi:type II toxin-antitoxin system RelE/ParE family toxin [Xenorhabdus bovienii]|uniref:Type II toxin-antitoxin system RelE/ParE family toxin n=1 Tax=Xenorhabdus bovienii TaxID=40576 RepID=A0AAJ1MYT7_XENBV|nr:type II toxin-antitoxin system RelE/ParE family toxin [Xenorhabdus bovienii]MDE1478103.1 type II toxin-antitoxin system RelE/ParE family toxin [Xenorhabdus bovienii]MDE1484880.1 type II toxin-antitoxin system RelE/ParE family toxin [Xenorhabdus bovienii]MDE1490360.1 type II toxin-antitoxin system RelE/ParE family toxin [Xenorhabdus bovienii]MDE9475643.1 type II toxin-antitoxin system RelE/ParE family toxin [Xenorhabdus bovienii]MDE9509778.1 type II toxin-antitoxin system RelE/ParE family to